jgi:polyhydroxyalkanoate synthesis regulator protein
MKPEYDFSNAVRGKFYRPQGQLKLPIYLEDEVLAFFVKQAELQGVEVNDLLNERLRREMERLETS